MSLSPEDFVRQRMVLEPVPFRPDISLYRPAPQSGIIRFLAEQGREDMPPYWAYAWAGGAALTLYLRDYPEAVNGKTVIDLGAGSGLVGIAAARAGAAAVLAVETDPLGRVAIALNAEANGADVRVWHEETMPEADIVLAGDVFYSAEAAARMLPLLQSMSAERQVLIGDPDRRDLPLAALECLARYRVPDMGGAGLVDAGIYSPSRPAPTSAIVPAS